MAITIVTTVGGATSNSYNTEDEATAYFEADPVFNTTWATTWDSTRRKQELVLSTRAIDALPLAGDRLYPATQALAFPRDVQMWALDWPTDEIPTPVKHAQLEAIRYRDIAADISTGQVSRDIDSVSVDGAVSVKFGNVLASEVSLIMGGNWERVQALMSRWLGASNAWRLSR